MANPSSKSPEMEAFLDNLSDSLFGRKRTESIQNDICTLCGGAADSFRSALSRQEYIISGMCQPCQDEVWPEED